MVDLKGYFTRVKGHGVLATADSSGKVNAAVYASPHIIDEGTAAFIMLDRLSHKNLETNPHAAYLFIERSEKLKGLRLYLTKLREEKNSELLYKLRRVKYRGDEDKDRFLVFFRVDKVLPLIGTNKAMLPK